MTLGIVVTVLVIAVGLPLLAWWVGSRPRWSREHAATMDAQAAQSALVRRHELSRDERAIVEKAATWGTAVPDTRLRSAVVEWAQLAQDAEASRPPLRSWLVLLVVGWGTVLAAVVVFAVVGDDWGGVNWSSLLQWAAFAWFVHLRRRGPARAIARNSTPVTPS